MIPSSFLISIYLGIPLIISLGTFLIKSVLDRLNEVEKKMQTLTSEPQVRQLLADRYDPLAQDIREIKEMQQKLLDMYIKFTDDSRKN